MKRLAVILTSFIALSSAHAKKLDIPIARYLPTMEETETVEVDWDESLFGAQPSSIYNHKIARIACVLSENAYVDVNKDVTNNEMSRTYRMMGVSDNAIEYHYDIDYDTPGLKNNQAAFSFGSKEIESAQGKKTLVFVVIRGTPMNAEEWTSNLSISDSSRSNSEVHEGFYLAMQKVHSALIYYLLKHKIDPDNTFFLITGHSRGAAVSNLLGAMMCDQNVFKTQNMYVYTFATPNVSTEEKTKSDLYGFIWNIVNASDVVPSVPPNRGNWEYKKYGHTLTLANSWNIAPDVYENNYYPRVNEIYKRLTKHDYSPFKTGPFLQIQIVRLLTSFYASVDKYYGLFGVRKKAERILKSAFKKPLAEEIAEEVESGPKDGTFMSFANRLTNNALENVSTTCLEMHLCETYLSWMLALNEDEAFSYMGSSQLIISGTFEGAIFDKDNNMLLRIYDGLAQIQTIKDPIGVMPILKTTVVGVPGNQDFTLVIYKDSIIPTRVPVIVEHYDAAGVLQSTSPVKIVRPHIGTAVVMEAGSKTVSDKIESQKLYGKASKQLVNSAQLKQQFKMTLTGEANINTDGNFGGGILFGSRLFYLYVMAEQYTTSITGAFDIIGGFGHSQPLYGAMLIDTELGGKIVFTDIDEKSPDLHFVPSAQVLVSLKPIHKTRFYIGGMFDLKIEDFNDEVFEPHWRPRNTGTININKKYAVIPSIKFGIRF